MVNRHPSYDERSPFATNKIALSSAARHALLHVVWHAIHLFLSFSQKKCYEKVFLDASRRGDALYGKMCMYTAKHHDFLPI